MTWLYYPGHFVAALLVAGLIAVYVIGFRSESWRNLSWRRWVLPPLQFLPAILLLLLLWDPSRARTTEKEVPNTVLAIFDTSESMSVADVDGVRLDKAAEVFEGVFRPGAKDAPEYAVYGFDAALHEADTPRALPRWGSRTSFGPVVDLLRKNSVMQEDGARRNVVGAVLFTDGQAAEKAASFPQVANDGFRVIVVGVGADKSPGDVAVTNIDAPSRALLDSGVPLRVTLGGTPAEGAKLHLELTCNGVPVDLREIDAATVASRKAIETVAPARPIGPMVVEARISSNVPESNSANDSRQTIVNVVEEPRLRVLFYSQWANFDIAKMREALSIENKVSLDFVYDVLNEDAGSSVAPPQMNANRRGLPETPEGINAYDIVVLGPLDSRKLSAGQVDALYSFVAERGGGLLVLPGAEDFDLALAKQPKIKALLPSLMTRGTWERGSVQRPIEVLLEGRAIGLPTAEALGEMPAELTPYYEVETKPAATVAARYDDTPALVFHRVGRGNVALLNLRRLFLLYKEEEGGPLRKLMSSIVTHLGATERDSAQTRVYAERMADDPLMVSFTASIFDTQFQPASGATVLLSVGDETVRMAESASGSYRAALRTRGEETLVARVEAVRDELLIGETTTTAKLPLPGGEMDRVERDRAFLQRAAARMNAAYYDLEQLPGDVAAFESSSTVEEIADVTSAWRTWTLLMVLCGMLSVAWFVRRFLGLV